MKRPWLFVLAGGFIAGALDMTYAWLFWFIKAGVAPRRIFQSVAAGWMGREAAVAGGWTTAALGLTTHFFIATTIALVYYVAARRVPLLWRRPLAMGALYGGAVYLVMNQIVVPLSAAAPKGPKDPLWVALSVVAHVFLIGVPIALFTRKAIRPEP